MAIRKSNHIVFVILPVLYDWDPYLVARVVEELLKTGLLVLLTVSYKLPGRIKAGFQTATDAVL
jgi:hypothetical protein